MIHQTNYTSSRLQKKMFTTLSNLKSLTVLFFNSAVRLLSNLQTFLTVCTFLYLVHSLSTLTRLKTEKSLTKCLKKLNIKRPKGKAVWSVKEGIEEANKLEYPLLVRPSYVLGGQGMEITRNEIDLVRYLTDAFIKDTKKSCSYRPLSWRT